MSSEELFQKNLALVADKNPGLAQNIRDLPLVNLHLIENPAGMVIGRMWDVKTQGWVPLCDPHHPAEEALADVQGTTEGDNPREGLYSPHVKVFVLLGIGLGYFAVEFARRLKPYQRLGIFDVSPHSFKAAMYTVDMGPILGAGGRVDTFLGDNLDAMLQHWFLTFNSHEKFYLSPPMRAAYTAAIDAHVYDGLMLRCMDMIRYHQVGLATWKQFGAHIGDNDMANMPEFFLNPGLNAMAGAWEGKPAVCIAAGPSLKKNLALLTNPEVRKRVAVICVGTMYATLQGLGIVPDIVTTIDFQRLNWTDQFLHVPLDKRSSLVYLHSTWPTTQRVWPGPRFVALNSSDIVEWMRTFDDEKMSASQVQTVAHLNLVVAQVLKANPIMLLGQDLGMPRHEHHAIGARVQDNNVDEFPEAHINAEDIYGQPCWTRHSFLSMRTVFQQMMANHPAFTYINCTEGGLNIEGAHNRSLADVLNVVVQEDPPAAVPLYTTLQRLHTAYVPQGRIADMIVELRHLSEVSSGLLQHAQDVLRLAEERDKARDRDDAATALDVMHQAMNREAVFHQAGLGFSLYAVRCFEIIETMSAIPPDPDETSEEFREEKVYQRVVTTAQAIQRETQNVQRGLAQTLKRLHDVLRYVQHEQPADATSIARLIAREHFHLALDALRSCQAAEVIRVRARIASRMQEYAMASALAEFSGQAEAIVRRCKQRLDAYWEGIFPLLPVYYRTPSVSLNGVVTPTPAVDKAEHPEHDAPGEGVEYPQAGEGLVPVGEVAVAERTHTNGH